MFHRTSNRRWNVSPWGLGAVFGRESAVRDPPLTRASSREVGPRPAPLDAAPHGHPRRGCAVNVRTPGGQLATDEVDDAPKRYLRSAWAPAAVVTVWFAWAYFHVRPSGHVSAAHAWATYGTSAFGHLAYSDVISLYYAFHLANHALVYVHTPVEYPVLTGLFMWLAAWVPGVQGYFLASTLGLCACAVGTTYILHRIEWRLAWPFALCPLLFVYGLLNWDLLAIFLMVAGWAQFRAHRYGWAGTLLSLAVWAKFFPVIVLFYCVVSLVGDGSSRRSARKMILTATVTAVLVNLPFAVANVGNWSHFYVFNARRRGSGGVLNELHLSSALSVSTVDLLSALLVLGAVGWLTPRVLRGVSPVVAAAATFAVLFLVGKVYSPQYMLWLFVLAIIAQWPAWTLVLMSVAGVVDYASSMTILYLSHTRSPAFGWFFRTIYPWNSALRNTTFALGLGWAALRGPAVATGGARGEVSPPPSELNGGRRAVASTVDAVEKGGPPPN